MSFLERVLVPTGSGTALRSRNLQLIIGSPECSLFGGARRLSKWVSTLLISSRTLADYPSPSRRVFNKETRKSYNYLTAERLVPSKKVSIPRAVLRKRDDKALARRNDYKQKLMQNIEEKIKYMDPDIKQFVFYPSFRNRHNSRRLFTGNRVLPPRTFIRIYFSVLKKITSGAHREDLIKLMKQAGLSELPEPDAWNRYTDPKTGDINIGLMYSSYMKRYFVRISKKHAPNCSFQCKKLFPIQAYIMRHFSDTSRVRSLAQWSDRFPRFQSGEFIESGRSMDAIALSLEQDTRDIKYYGKREIEAVISSMSTEELYEMLDYVAKHEEELFEKMCKQFFFVSQVMLALNTLPEIKAIQSPLRVYLFEREMRSIYEHRGSWFPAPKKNPNEFRTLPEEERMEYYCFKSFHRKHTASGLQLFLLSARRDYGADRSEILKEYFNFTDLQQAALNFPFYLPISPPTPSSAAFRKFYIDMCIQCGLGNKVNNNCVCNRLFETAMRKKWKMLHPSEREKYFQLDTHKPAFPLQPAASNELDPSAVPSKDASHTQLTAPEDGVARIENKIVGEDTMEHDTASSSKKYDHPCLKQSLNTIHGQSHSTPLAQLSTYKKTLDICFPRSTDGHEAASRCDTTRHEVTKPTNGTFEAQDNETTESVVIV